MTRQRAYQLRNAAAGKCSICPEPKDPNSALFCRTHAIAHRKRARVAADCKAWRPGGVGRPPKVR